MIEHAVPSLDAWLIMAGWIVLFIFIAQRVSRTLRGEVKDLL
jgi:hypothetical protein